MKLDRPVDLEKSLTILAMDGIDLIPALAASSPAFEGIQVKWSRTMINPKNINVIFIMSRPLYNYRSGKHRYKLARLHGLALCHFK